MSLFAIADLHLSLGVDKPMDVFPGWEGYVQKLEENWRRNVQPEDTVVIAGDLSWALDIEESVEDFSFLNSLPGTKILLKGITIFGFLPRPKWSAFLKNMAFQP